MSFVGLIMGEEEMKAVNNASNPTDLHQAMFEGLSKGLETFEALTNTKGLVQFKSVSPQVLAAIENMQAIMNNNSAPFDPRVRALMVRWVAVYNKIKENS